MLSPSANLEEHTTSLRQSSIREVTRPDDVIGKEKHPITVVRHMIAPRVKTLPPLSQQSP
jgi:hypothetical protein